MKPKPDMQQVTGLDDTAYHCPCGASFFPDPDRYEDTKKWMRKHVPHTSGFVVDTITERGASVYASHPAPSRRSLGNYLR